MMKAVVFPDVQYDFHLNHCLLRNCFLYRKDVLPQVGLYPKNFCRNLVSFVVRRIQCHLCYTFHHNQRPVCFISTVC